MKTRLALLALFPLLLLGLVVITPWRYLWSVFSNPDKAWNIALMIDETGNVDANGKVNTTISARAARAQIAGKTWGCVLCKVLDWIQPNHCKDSLLP